MSDLPAYLRETVEGCTLAVRVQPGAKRTAIVGVYGDGAQAQLKIAVQAPPVEGKANAKMVVFLSEAFSVSRSSVEILSGESSRSKVFLIRGLSLSQAKAAIGKVPAEA